MKERRSMKLRDSMDDGGNRLRERLEEVLNSEYGFIILCDEKKLTDFYQGICPDCVVEEVKKAVNEFANLFGTLPKNKIND